MNISWTKKKPNSGRSDRMRSGHLFSVCQSPLQYPDPRGPGLLRSHATVVADGLIDGSPQGASIGDPYNAGQKPSPISHHCNVLG